jgi:tryptophan halogenase
MDVPKTLIDRMDLYRAHGRIYREHNELFTKLSWLQVLQGQRVHPVNHHPLASLRSDAEIQEYLEDIDRVIQACVNIMPTHAQFIAEHCAAQPMSN